MPWAVIIYLWIHCLRSNFFLAIHLKCQSDIGISHPKNQWLIYLDLTCLVDNFLAAHSFVSSINIFVSHAWFHLNFSEKHLNLCKNFKLLCLTQKYHMSCFVMNLLSVALRFRCTNDRLLQLPWILETFQVRFLDSSA